MLRTGRRGERAVIVEEGLRESGGGERSVLFAGVGVVVCVIAEAVRGRRHAGQSCEEKETYSIE